MTEKSYYHNGTAFNDALESPYSAEEFAELQTILNAPVGNKYVLPGQLNNLAVTAGAGRSVDVASGRAFINGYWYENTANVNLALSTNTSGMPRWDRVVVQLNLATGVGSLKIIEGGYTSVPSIPELAPAETVIQMTLARVYIPDSYAAVSAYYVHDERVFGNNAYHQINYSTRNLFINGNFILFGCNQGATASRRPMDAQWAVVNNGTRWRGVEGLPSQMYGRAVRSDLATAIGDGFSTILLTSETLTDPHTLSLWVWPTAGEAVIAFGGTTMRVPPTQEAVQIIIRGSFTGYQTLSITHQTTDTDFVFSDIRLAHGYLIAEERHIGPALVMLSLPVQAQKTGAPNFAGLTGTGLIDTAWKYWGSDEDYDGVVVAHSPVAELVIIIQGVDTGSAATAPLVAIVPADATANMFQLDLGGVPNGANRYVTGLVMQNYLAYPDGLRVLISYTAGTGLTFSVWVVGAIL